jgi:hypothetical protein
MASRIQACSHTGGGAHIRTHIDMHKSSLVRAHSPHSCRVGAARRGLHADPCVPAPVDTWPASTGAKRERVCAITAHATILALQGWWNGGGVHWATVNCLWV